MDVNVNTIFAVLSHLIALSCVYNLQKQQTWSLYLTHDHIFPILADL